MAKYELEIEIDPRDVDKREKLCTRIGIALMMNEIRVLAGEYVVTIERKSAASIRREEREASAEAAASAPKASSDEPNACSACGRWACTRQPCDGEGTPA